MLLTKLLWHLSECCSIAKGEQVRLLHVLLNVAWLLSAISRPILPSQPPFLSFFWVPFIPPSPPDAYHCGRSIKCNVCRRGIIGNMWWELKMLSHFKLPIICSKGACIVLQSAWKKKQGEREEAEERPESLSCTWLKRSSDKISVAPCWLLSSS